MARSQKAQALHTALIHCIDTPCQESHLAFERLLKVTPVSALTEVSANGCTHLMDALHLTYRIKDDQHEASKISLYLFNALKNRLKKDSTIEAWIFMLTKESQKNFTPLLEVLIDGETVNVEAYLNEIKDYIEHTVAFHREHPTSKLPSFNNSLTYSDMQKHTPDRRNDPHVYVKLLTSTSSDGFNAFHILLNGEKTDRLKLYLQILHRCINQSWLKYEDYAQLLIQRTEHAFTPLHEVLKTGSEESLRLYFNELKNCLSKGALTSASYVELLTQVTFDGDTPFIMATNGGSSAKFQIYLGAIKECLENKWLDHSIYGALLIGNNKAGFTPLFEALAKGDAENLKIYLATVEEAFENAWIKKEAYKQLLIGKTQSGFNPLHQALKRGNPYNVKAYFQKLNDSIEKNITTPEEYIALLTEKNNSGFTALHDALKKGNLENLQCYFEALGKCIKNNDYKREAYCQFLVEANEEGFTPLHIVCKAGSLNCLKLYFNQCEFFLPHEKIRALLESKTKYGYFASCPKEHAESEEILKFLNEKRLSAIKKAQGMKTRFWNNTIPCEKKQLPLNWRTR